MTAMGKGSNVSLSAMHLRVDVRWAPASDAVVEVDVATLLLGAAGKVRSDADFVFYNQPTHLSGAVTHVGLDAETRCCSSVVIDLRLVEDEIERVVIAASTEAGGFSQVPGLRMVVVDSGNDEELATFDIADADSEMAFVFGEVYRRDGGWKLRAIGQGYASGLAGLATDFGIDVGESADSDDTLQHELAVADVELISDGDGIAVIGEQKAVERWLSSAGLASRDLELPRLSAVLSATGATAQAASGIAANSGRWVKLTEKSAQTLKASSAMKGSTEGVSRAMTTHNGKITGILEFVSKPGVRSMMTNPAVLAGAAGIMAQLAMQQTMDEITSYLEAIDEKVDDLLRAHTDAVLADMIGVDLVIKEAMTIRAEVGRVSEVTWSKVQGTSMVVSRTQGYALRQLDALAKKLEQKSKIGDLAEASKVAEVKGREWLAVLARCFQLQDAIAVLELDRVLDAAPDELDRHRVALRTARQHRRELIVTTTQHLIGRMDAAAGTANEKVLLHPAASGAIVRASNQVATDVVTFHGVLGIEQARESLEAKRWAQAATEARDKVLVTGVGGVDAAKVLGTETVGRARSATGKLSKGVAERSSRLRRGSDKTDGDS